MNTSSFASLRALFDAALELPPGERVAYLRTHCPDPALRARVAALLEADARTSDSLHHDWAGRIAQGLGEDESSTHDTPALPPDGCIGPFRILRVIGEGGFSTVFEAGRDIEGVTQRVALKLLHCGLHTADARRRFEHERRALLQLKHPNITRLIDAGVTDTGQPYIALELVDGVPITDYARRHRLDLSRRLTLFTHVCQAVDAAHRALIVHRDIKPSNVLVSPDGTVSLLDFGIAKLLDDPDEHRTLAPAFTPAYAAPEQQAGGPITTATDVYALGILLDELVTSERRAPGETRRPSARVTDTTEPDALPAPPRAMRKLLRGDLDNIVLKAIAEEPGRRYASASALAEDIQRHLAHQPVLAHPPSNWYRTRKFIARHRGGVAMAAIVLVAILASLGTALWQARLARGEAARANAMRDFMFDVFSEAEPGAPRSEPPRITDIAEKAIARAREGGIADARASVELQTRLGAMLRAQGAVPQAREHLGQVHEEARRAFGDDDALTRDAAAELVNTLALAGDLPAARTLADALLASPVRDDRFRSGVLTNSTLIAYRQGDYHRALSDAQAAVALARRVGDKDRLGQALMVNAQAHISLRDYAAAAALAQELLDVQTERFGPLHHRTATAHMGLSIILREMGDLDASEQHIRTALRIIDAVLPRDDYRRASFLGTRMMLQIVRRDIPGALESAQESLRIMRAAFGPEHPEGITHLNNVGMMQFKLGHCGQAEDTLRQALALSTQHRGQANPQTLRNRFNYGTALACAGDFAGGAAHIRQAAEALENAEKPNVEEAAAAWEKLARLHLDRHEPDLALAVVDRIDALLAKVPKLPLFWPGRSATLRANALLQNADAQAALVLLDAASLEAGDNADAELPVETALLRALAAVRLDHEQAAERAQAARALLSALPMPPARLLEMERRLPAVD